MTPREMGEVCVRALRAPVGQQAISHLDADYTHMVWVIDTVVNLLGPMRKVWTPEEFVEAIGESAMGVPFREEVFLDYLRAADTHDAKCPHDVVVLRDPRTEKPYWHMSCIFCPQDFTVPFRCEGATEDQMYRFGRHHDMFLGSTRWSHWTLQDQFTGIVAIPRKEPPQKPQSWFKRMLDRLR